MAAALSATSTPLHCSTHKAHQQELLLLLLLVVVVVVVCVHATVVTVVVGLLLLPQLIPLLLPTIPQQVVWQGLAHLGALLLLAANSSSSRPVRCCLQAAVCASGTWPCRRHVSC